MASPFDDLAFLTGSKTRIQMLQMLAAKPRTRTELQEAMEVSRKTIGRTLGAFTERGWAIRDGPTYEATPLGALMAEDVVRLCDTVEMAQELRDVAKYLPTEAFDFDLRRLGNARLSIPTPEHPDAPLERALELVDSTENLRSLTYSTTRLFASAVHDRVLDAGMDCVFVFTDDGLDHVANDPALAALYREIVDAGGTIRRYDGRIPAIVSLWDEIATIGMHGEGTRQAIVETTDRTVRTWAEETFETYEHEAEPVTADTFMCD
jgi:predicted transcriptional regulator